jgi:hypothetical protein
MHPDVVAAVTAAAAVSRSAAELDFLGTRATLLDAAAVREP